LINTTNYEPLNVRAPCKVTRDPHNPVKHSACNMSRAVKLETWHLIFQLNLCL